MDKSSFEMLDCYERRIALKLSKLSQMERAAFMADIFGRGWEHVYHRLCAVHPELLLKLTYLQNSE